MSKAIALATAIALVLIGGTNARATVAYAPKHSPLFTQWTGSVSTVAPLPDYPRPQLQRADWLNLNGRWQYERAMPGQAPPFGQPLSETILVPFPVQSPLSGIERGDTAGWYRRTFQIPRSWVDRRVLLNFGAISWAARVFVNGRLAGAHRGDYDGFSLDITPLLHRGGVNELVVGFLNPIGGADEPVGKQVPGAPYADFHTASSGIWQTVWLEPVAREHVTGLDLVPDLRHSRLIVSAGASGARRLRVIAQALAGPRVVATATGFLGRPLALGIAHPRLWWPSDPYLYGLRVRLLDGHRTVDRIRSYFGMRSISLGRVTEAVRGRGGGAARKRLAGPTRILLNGRFVFQTGALDQGYWPDGLYTAPTDAALRFDIDAARRLGYDMLRKHVKVEPDRWYYWADKLGILVWQDMPNPPVAMLQPLTRSGRIEFRRELSAIVRQRRSHPSIVTWVPFNEGWGQFDLAVVRRQIRRLDPTRLVDTQSGSANCCDATESPASDIRDAHLYTGPFAVRPDRRASAIGEYGAVLPFAPASHRWPGVATSVGSPALAWPVSWINGVLRAQYAQLAQEVRVQGLSAAVFTEFTAQEQELGILSYDRRVYTLDPTMLRHLNESLIARSQQSSQQPARIPSGTTGLWRFDEARGTRAADTSGHRHQLTLQGGAGWTRGIHGSALSITGAGQEAVARGPVLDTRHSFTVSAWLNSRLPYQTGTAISQVGTAGSSFSLGIETTGPGLQSRPGQVASGARPPPHRAWWTFVVPSRASCPSSQCAVKANMRYDDGRSSPRAGRWHQVTGVYDAGTQTISLYVDGIPEDVEHASGVPPARGPLTVGAGALDYPGSDVFIGAIDELRLYGRALSPKEVWGLHEAER
jgi:hypothetical protein